MLITRTPYRFSLYGGGLDYPEWYEKESAQVLCAGLDYYCYHTVRLLPPFFSHRYRAAYSIVETTSNIEDIKHPSIREVLRAFGDDHPMEIAHIGDLPSRSGIGSSSAFTVGLVNSLSALRGRFLGRSKLAQEAIRLEQKMMGEKVGFQDQCAAAFGSIVFVEADSTSIRPRRFVSRTEYIKYIASNLLMGFDGVQRFSSVASSRVSNSILDETKSSLMHELLSLSKLGIQCFGDEAEIDQHAKITRECRDIKLYLNGDAQNQRTIELIHATEKAGSLCTRIMGAGGGGFFVCWAPPNKHAQIKESVKVKTWVDVRFSNSGSQVIFSES
jgi:D-glycero-alpha-D-manno-heptose-7-phosphate kinase